MAPWTKVLEKTSTAPPMPFSAPSLRHPAAGPSPGFPQHTSPEAAHRRAGLQTTPQPSSPTASSTTEKRYRPTQQGVAARQGLPQDGTKYVADASRQAAMGPDSGSCSLPRECSSTHLPVSTLILLSDRWPTPLATKNPRLPSPLHYFERGTLLGARRICHHILGERFHCSPVLLAIKECKRANRRSSYTMDPILQARWIVPVGEYSQMSSAPMFRRIQQPCQLSWSRFPDQPPLPAPLQGTSQCRGPLARPFPDTTYHTPTRPLPRPRDIPIHSPPTRPLARYLPQSATDPAQPPTLALHTHPTAAASTHLTHRPPTSPQNPPSSHENIPPSRPPSYNGLNIQSGRHKY